ncbi:MAG TPA: DUF433 domain-containing protein [Chloroflexota bacterium]|jgi:uncharacterized protein (DUF433 family)|nr:DUF433 domain-containing protein [Chloroflexota bacterium]
MRSSTANPTVKGSRISVAAIARLLNAGVGVEEIATTYEHLSLASTHDAISDYLDHHRGISSGIQSKQRAPLHVSVRAHDCSAEITE